MWGIELQTKHEISLSRQIFLSIKEKIIKGRIAPGEALPSTRELAKNLAVSRNTVCEAYDMLLTEGFIVNRQGAPTRVVEDLVIEDGVRSEEASVHESETGESGQRAMVKADFRTGRPDLLRFPWQLWNRMLRDAAQALPVADWGYRNPKGYEPLCEEIAMWLFRSRSMNVNPQDVFITAGSTQALFLLTDLLYKEGFGFGIEKPSHPGFHTIIADRDAPYRWMPVDSHGADVDELDGSSLSAVYVTPSHQYPLGGILPASRRAALIRLAREHDFYIIEDDYDSEFRYSGPPVSPIYSMDSSHVVYVGTFSKTLFPALRIGFVVLPKALQTEWKHRRMYLDVQNPVLEQAVLAEFLRTRKMDKHVRSMRRIYGEKREILLETIRGAFGSSVHAMGDASGLHMVLHFPGAEFGTEFVEDSKAVGVKVQPLACYCPGGENHIDKLLLGYGHLNLNDIGEGIKMLQPLIDKYRCRR
ncbi:PLP-dependent aminotransferase family protein [Gorillibacterium massiliense]|uniref:MocR-like pyridoxine biosynthesis transcription factor PdxR n=1 Tax=Gorillibacterium massiliense TaxID=1280390 RepID=UPI0004B17C33|nr:PLP-dependent aminotransferase family protein [Gorillibacterium massiliense]